MIANSNKKRQNQISCSQKKSFDFFVFNYSISLTDKIVVCSGLADFCVQRFDILIQNKVEILMSPINVKCISIKREFCDTFDFTSICYVIFIINDFYWMQNLVTL